MVSERVGGVCVGVVSERVGGVCGWVVCGWVVSERVGGVCVGGVGGMYVCMWVVCVCVGGVYVCVFVVCEGGRERGQIHCDYSQVQVNRAISHRCCNRDNPLNTPLFSSVIRLLYSVLCRENKITSLM